MIEFDNVSVVFGKKPEQALPLLAEGKGREAIREETGLVVGVHRASLKVGKGEICVLMGLSGSGKSTLLRCINGLNPITDGAVRIEHEGESVDFARASDQVQRDIRRRRISMVFQSFALMPWLTVEQNVGFGLELQGLPKNERREKVTKQLELVGLDQWKDRLPDELSGGMRQRVGLARALATESDILLMDEPFSALDPLIRQQLQEELLELQERLQKTIVFVSHDLDEALKLGTNIAIMKNGEIVQHGKPEQIILHPANDYVKNFVAHTNPLNVLKVKSLMRPVSDMRQDDEGNRCISQRYDYWLITHDEIEQTRVRFGEEFFETQPWTPGQSIENLEKKPARLSPRTLMRDAVEICYVTGHSPLIEENGVISGALGEREIYHALLSKHLGED